MSGCHIDAILINMHEFPKISAEGEGCPLRMSAEGEGHLLRPLSLV